MSDLVGFLLARITEDEAPKPRDRAHEDWCMDRSRLDGDDGPCAYCGHPADPSMVELVQPSARVLAECEAKRRIVEYAVERDEAETKYGTGGQETGAANACADVLCLLALPYADHPDYDPTWRP